MSIFDHVPILPPEAALCHEAAPGSVAPGQVPQAPGQLTLNDAPRTSFITTLLPHHLPAIQASPYVVFDLETTALTLQDTPVTVGKTAQIGGTTFNQYAKALSARGVSVSVDTTPRARIISVGIRRDGQDIGWAFDLDALAPQDVIRLFTACIANQVLIGHNLAFDLSWAQHYTPDAKPRAILDTMLIARTMRPSLPLAVGVSALIGNSDAQAVLNASGPKGPGVSLADIAVALGHPKPDKTHQKPANWAISHLSPSHYEYVMSDVHLPLAILNQLLRCPADERDPAAWLSRLSRPYFNIFMPAVQVLVEAHGRGMPLHFKHLDDLQTKLISEINTLADSILALAPSLHTVDANLRSLSISLTDQVKEALAAHASEHGITLPRTDKGNVSMDAKATKLAGLDKLPVWPLWSKLQGVKKRVGMLGEYRDLAAHDPGAPGYGRLRSLIGINTATGRTSSQVPNVQNLPRDPEFRAIIAARPGHKVLAIDYGQIELRIAAALAIRATEQAKAALWHGEDSAVKPWVREALEAGNNPSVPLVEPPDPTYGDIASYMVRYHYDLASSYRAIVAQGTPLAEVFRQGLDPHLLTAVGMAAKAGALDLSGLPPLQFLTAHEDHDALKATLKVERQQAKALNFGLLYGMGAEGLHAYGIASYGLSWTIEEATQAREDWFALYPEVRFWHHWTKHTKKRQRQATMARNKYSGTVERTQQQSWLDFTLSGRPVVATELREVLNHQDQGSGADMALLALATLPQDCRAYFINLVHDELIFEVPAEKVDKVQADVLTCMLSAADKLLAPYGIPADAEASVGDVWIH